MFLFLSWLRIVRIGFQRSPNLEYATCLFFLKYLLDLFGHAALPAHSFVFLQLWFKLPDICQCDFAEPWLRQRPWCRKQLQLEWGALAIQIFSGLAPSRAAWGWTMDVPTNAGFTCEQGTTIGASGGSTAANFTCTVVPDSGMSCDVSTIYLQCSDTDGGPQNFVSRGGHMHQQWNCCCKTQRNSRHSLMVSGSHLLDLRCIHK